VTEQHSSCVIVCIA